MSVLAASWKQQLTAKRLLEKRLAVEQLAVNATRAEIRKLFSKIAELGYASQLPPMMFRFSRMRNQKELDDLLAELRMFLYMVEEEYAQRAVKLIEDEYGAPTPLLASEYINKENHGKTLKQRNAIYTERLKMEMEAWVATGLLLGLSVTTVKQMFKNYSDKPYTNPSFIKAASMVKGDTAATRLVTNGISYGRGIYTSAESALERLLRCVIGDMSKLAQFLCWGSSGKLIGYYVGRGSSYPCELCDDETGFKAIGFDNLPPYHANCKCWAAPVYATAD